MTDTRRDFLKFVVAGSVAALAAELGFKDTAYFCRFFRRHNGVSPGEYRRGQAGG